MLLNIPLSCQEEIDIVLEVLPPAPAMLETMMIFHYKLKMPYKKSEYAPVSKTKFLRAEWYFTSQ